MSSTGDPSEAVGSAEEAAEQDVDTEAVGGLGEILPEPLRPLWRPVGAVQEFRRTHSDTYITAMEVVVAAMLTGGYVWWLYLFVTG
jgi:hypothetical protein